jgi:hypothetical protein
VTLSIHHFDAAVWGTVAAWVGSLLSGFSVLLVLYVIYRDRLKDLQRQANDISVWKTTSLRVGDGNYAPYTLTVTISNHSDRPVRTPLAIARPRSIKLLMKELDPEQMRIFQESVAEFARGDAPELRTFVDGAGQLVAKRAPSLRAMFEAHTTKGPIEIPAASRLDLEMSMRLPSYLYSYEVRFTDSGSHVWYKDLETGKLASHSLYDSLVERLKARLGWYER